MLYMHYSITWKDKFSLKDIRHKFFFFRAKHNVSESNWIYRDLIILIPKISWKIINLTNNTIWAHNIWFTPPNMDKKKPTFFEILLNTLKTEEIKRKHKKNFLYYLHGLPYTAQKSRMRFSSLLLCFIRLLRFSFNSNNTAPYFSTFTPLLNIFPQQPLSLAFSHTFLYHVWE